MVAYGIGEGAAEMIQEDARSDMDMISSMKKMAV
jgi:hypothetical protein